MKKSHSVNAHARPKDTPKRKYTKRSKFWAKKQKKAFKEASPKLQHLSNKEILDHISNEIDKTKLHLANLQGFYSYFSD